MAATTASLRFPGYTYSDMSSIVSALTPIRRCHYLLSGFTPFSGNLVDQAKGLRKTTVHDIMRRLVQPKNIIASISPTRQSCFISAFNILRGSVDSSEVKPASQKMSNCI